MARITKIQVRRGTAAAWTSANPTLAAGEPGLETDTRKIKYGDGSTAWNSLAYAVGGTLTIQVPISLTTTDATGNAYAAQVAPTNIREVVPAFTKDVVGDWWGIVRVPQNFVSTAKVIASIAANATTGVTTMGLASKNFADAATYDTALTSEADQDITVPATAYKRKDVTFTLTNQPVAGDDLIVRIRHNGTAANDTLAVDTLLFLAVFQYST